MSAISRTLIFFTALSLGTAALAQEQPMPAPEASNMPTPEPGAAPAPAQAPDGTMAAPTAVPDTASYPVCSRTVTDKCVNRSAAKRPR